jgi:ABC-type polysaccharide/polyol phosphate export permease
MTSKFKSYLKLFWQLVRTDLIIFKQGFVDSLIDTFILVTLLVIVVTYIYPSLGMSTSFGPFFAVGMVATSSLFQVWPAAVNFISDLEGNKTITYPLTLPIPSWMVMVSKSIGWACKNVAISILILPAMKILLWDRMDLSNLMIGKFLLMFFSVSIFFGFFSLFMASLVKDMNNVDSVWIRVLFPLWFVGCAEFPWTVLHGLNPNLAYLNFINPITYVMEGIRSPVLGHENFLPFWFCFGMVWLFCFAFGWMGVKRLKKRLDFV